MNLLQFKNKYFKIDNSDEITIENFRQKQYDSIENYCKLIIDYIIQQNDKIFKFHSIEIKNNINYIGITNSKTNEITINVELEDGTIKKFLVFFMPALIDDNHFFINGNLYTPLIYAIDMPIIIKKESFKLWSLFNSITFNPKRNICIFCMNNIPIDYILSIFLLYNNPTVESLELYELYIKKYNLVKNNFEESDIIAYFSNLFKKCEDINEVINILESVFFDNYSRELYTLQYFNEIGEINLTTIIRKAIKDDLEENVFNFIDLNNKRLIFIELLFKPIFKRLSNIIVDILKGKKYTELLLNQAVILKHFLSSPNSKIQNNRGSGLAGNYLYDTSNLYSSILNHKINMIAPGIENAPKDVQGVHESHFRKICPITISSQNPGNVVSVIYDTKLDKFGRFI